MLRTRAGVFTLLFMASAFLFSVAPVKAGEVPAEIKESVIFYLDWGFVGRAVSLELNGGKTSVSWEAGDLIAPTMLMVEIEKSATTTQNGAELADEVIHLTWADPYHLSSRGVKVSNACVSGAWTSCAVYKQDGETWKESADGRAYGHSRVRMGLKKTAYMQAGKASWYKYKNCRCAASPDFPKGTRLRVRSLLTGKYTVVRINDWGPERDKFPERVIDLDVVAFKEFAPLGAGVISVSVEPIEIADPDYKLADELPPAPITAVATITPAPIPVAKNQTGSDWSY